MSDVQPDTAAAIAFLRHWPEPWVLTAIDPEKKQAPETRSFGRNSEREAAVWIERWQGVWNVYFSVNQPKVGHLPTKKMGKAEIGSARALHCDVDPADPPEGCIDVTAHYARERIAILARIEAHSKRPSLCIDSGNGFQPIWELVEPYAIKTAGEIEQIESRNRQLEHELVGDNCHNIDRILRLPGTLNIPDAKKRAKGRVVTLAKLVWREERRHSVSDFNPSVKCQNERPKSKAGPNPEVNGERNPEERLRPGEPIRNIANNLYKIMREGLAADTKGHYNGDRSRALFAINCALVRANLSISEIRDINLARSNKLTEHVYEQSDPAKYALRQAEQAFAAVLAEIEATADLPELGSEDMLAVTFVNAHSLKLRHVAEMGRWYRWDGCKWAVDRTNEVLDMVRHHIRTTTSRSIKRRLLSLPLKSWREATAEWRWCPRTSTLTRFCLTRQAALSTCVRAKCAHATRQ